MSLKYIFLGALAAVAALGACASAASYIWDSNGTTAGAGATPNGTWGVDPYWGTSGAGTGVTANTVTTSVAGGHTVTLNGDTFTRTAGATLDLPLSISPNGTLTSTMANLRFADLQNGIIGPWASAGLLTSSSNFSAYATINESNRVVTYLSGTPAATPANLTDTTGNVNYDLAVNIGTAPNVVSANTIRFRGSTQGTTVLGDTSFTVNGLMHASDGAWTIGSTTTNSSTPLTIGPNRELVMVCATLVTINSIIQDNPAGASGLTITGDTRLHGANTYTGTTTINQGSLELFQGGSLSDIGAVVINGGVFIVAQTQTTETIGSIASLSGTTINVFTNKNLTTGENNASTTVAGQIRGGGSITKQGTGMMTLSGANTYTGGTTVSAGTLLANNTTGSATGTGAVLVNGGTLGGSGTVSGPVSITTGTLAPGASIESLDVGGPSMTMTFGNSVTLSSATTTVIEIGGTVSDSQYDHIDVTGSLTLGGTLDIDLLNDFAPELGDSFNILDFNSSLLTGSFDTLLFPALDEGLAWNTSALYSTGVLSVTLAGDYNLDGTVNAADYTVWRDTLGSTTNLAANSNGNTVIDAGDYEVWKQNFGEPSGSGSLAAVPEPASLVLLVAGMLAFIVRRSAV